MTRILVLMTALLVASPALATDLINKDDKSYEVEAYCKSGTPTRTKIKPKSTISKLCASCSWNCRIKLDGAIIMEVPEKSDVIIKDGKMKKK